MLAFLVLATTACSLFDNSGQDRLEVSVTPVSSVEAWMVIRAGEDDQIAVKNPAGNESSFRMSRADTLLRIENLTPGATITVAVQNRSTKASRTVQANLPDTTSSRYEWQLFEAGVDYRHSILRDVKIVGADSIVAAGIVYTANNPEIPFHGFNNLVVWKNGAFSVRALEVNGSVCGSNLIPELYALDILVSGFQSFYTGGSLFRVNTRRQLSSLNCQPPVMRGVPHHLHIRPDSSILVAGSNGMLFQWRGNRADSLPTGTRNGFEDMWVDGNDIYLTYPDLYKHDGKTLTTLVKGTPRPVAPHFINGFGYSVWAANELVYFTTGNELYRMLATYPNFIQRVSPGGIQGAGWVRGTAPNNIVLMGADGALSQFNGARWRIMTTFESNLRFTHRIDVTDKMVAAVGTVDKGPIHTVSFLMVGKKY
jgi:hypothetical protein